MTLPNLIIAGAPKCGTTSLYSWLDSHPGTCGSSQKETLFFLDPDTPLRPRLSCHTDSLESYASFFSHARGDETIVFEATPDYLYAAAALQQLRRLAGPPQIVFVLRKPSRRIYSLYQFARNNVGSLKPGISFEQYVAALLHDPGAAFLRDRPLLRNAIAHSRYFDWIQRWLDAFPAQHIHIFQFESLRADARRFMQSFATLFGLDPSFYETYDFSRHNVSYRVRSSRLHRAKRLAASGLAGCVPQGLRHGAAALYRRLNTAVPVTGLTEPDRAALNTLDARFEQSNAQLAEVARIDLDLWA